MIRNSSTTASVQALQVPDSSVGEENIYTNKDEEQPSGKDDVDEGTKDNGDNVTSSV